MFTQGETIMQGKFRLIKDLNDIGVRYNIKVTVIESQKVVDRFKRQEGTISDGSGSIKFIVWSDSGLPYLEEGKEYILKDILLYDYKGTLQVQFDKFSAIGSKELEKLKKAFQKMQEERKNISKSKYKLKVKEKDIEDTRKHIDHHMEKTRESIIFLENKKSEMRQEKFLTIFGSILFLIIIISGIFYIYDFASRRIAPKLDDIIHIVMQNEKVMYRVVEEDKENNIITLESMDEYKEKIRIKSPQKMIAKDIEKPQTAVPVKQKGNISLTKRSAAPVIIPKKKTVSAGNVKSYSPDAAGTSGIKTFILNGDRIDPYEKSRQSSETVYINSENNNSVLLSLPGIGSKRLYRFKTGRPYYSLVDILDAKIGIGAYWADQWEEYIKEGRIVFD